MLKASTINQNDFETTYKKIIFERTHQLCSSQSILLSNINYLQEHADLKIDMDLPNIGITFNNKLIEFISIFKSADISMFSQSFENYGPLKQNFTSSCF